MQDIYITGHRNPDIDSVCSAYAYAELKNAIDKENNYIAVRCGHLGQSTKEVLESLGIDIPPYRRDVFPKVSDVVMTTKTMVDADETLTTLALSHKDSSPSVAPIFDKGKFYGLISVDDITSWLMSKLSSYETIEQAPRIRDLMHEQDQPLQLNDMFDEAKSRIYEFKKRGIAVYDGDNYVGYVTRRCFLNTPRYKVILVDHNERGQSIRGIDTADVVEIIDHHRLDSMKTALPIFIDAEPLGSTCTIVYRHFVRNGLQPSEGAAKAMLAGIISDTLILKSPTTTAVDVDCANELAKICGVDVTEFGKSMFSHVAGLKDVDPVSAIKSDFKKYKERGVAVGIGQCEVTTLIDFEEYSEKYSRALELVRTQLGLDWAVIMITDVLKEHSILLSTEHRATKHLQYTAIGPNIYDMPGVLSRKKQLLPEVLHSLEY